MQPDLWSLYRQMLRSRRFEEAVIRIWNDGRISGEMHLGIGEEAVAAGVVAHLRDGDAMALDHRGTPPLLMRGVDAVALLQELLGRPDGLCAGMGGHMHLFSPQHLAASSGIVGASGPAAVGFALAAQLLRPGNLAVAFFGEGAMNQGMLMESMNLAVVWKLPVLFVCKNSQWAITTFSSAVTGGSLIERARAFGMHAVEVDGSDVVAVWHAAHETAEKARRGEGPAFLHTRCMHLEGHFLGDPLLRITRHPVKEMKEVAGALLKSATRAKGAPLPDRVKSLAMISSLIGKTAKADLLPQQDPLELMRQKLNAESARLQSVEAEVNKEIDQAVARAVAPIQ